MGQLILIYFGVRFEREASVRSMSDECRKWTNFRVGPDGSNDFVRWGADRKLEREASS